MTRNSWRRAVAVLPLLLALSAPAAEAQYFGRNKVQYETFPWRILRSDHFDNFFYPAESLHVNDAARMAERWYSRHSDTFRHAFDRKSLIFYADHPDFEQTNVIGEQLEEGTGGVTESNRTRVIMPFTGSYADDDHVLGHELVHVFQYNIAEAAPQGGLARLGVLPQWLVEGMAEYFSLGRHDALTTMWMRDAVMRNKFPTIKQLTTDPRFFPYRYGQALWAYVGGRWGDRAIIDLYRQSLRIGWDQALVRTLGENQDSLSKDWAAANRAMFLPQIAGRQHPDSVGRLVIPEKRSGDYNLAPTLSPDGKLIAFFSSRSLFSIDLFVADAKTGRVIRKLAGPSSDPHFDAISFINSAGDWSPDGSKFAFIVYASGNNEIAILDTKSGNVDRRIRIPTVGAILHTSWSPDGKTLAFSGLSGGLSDLYLLDLETGNTRRLTNDRFADLQPTWSPDGKTLAFTTDRGPNTDFNTLKYGQLNLATYDVATGQIRVFAPFSSGKHINPQFSPDGKDLFFVSDQDGISDVYRLDVPTGAVYRVTHVATGISGITSISPAISVSRTTGLLTIDVFKDQGHEIEELTPEQSQGTMIDVAATAGAGSAQNAATLPPGEAPRSVVAQYLADPTTGLVSGQDFTVEPYHPSFSLDALGQPSIGVATGGPFGTGVAGGVSAFFGDQLSDQQIVTAIQANGTVKDIGGAVYYQNLRRRWNYGAGLEHIPYLTGGVLAGDTGSVYGTNDPICGSANAPNGNCYNIYQLLQRIYVDQASFLTSYPFSSTRRFEFNLSATRLAYDEEIDELTIAGGQLVAQQRNSRAGPPPVYYVQPQVALAGDNSFAAFTSPVAGSRWRLEYSPTVGSFNFQTALADYRKYVFMQPFSLAFRAMHYGRYGKDSENGQLYPLYLGEETLIRGYGYGSIDPSTECTSRAQQAPGSCPVLDRLFGSRLAVANLEFRIPLFGTSEFGLLDIPFLPVELSPFFDAGVAYTSTEAPDWRLTRDAGSPLTCNNSSSVQQFTFSGCADRIPVFSTGLSARINVLGYLILEAYFAHPFQRPEKSWVWGFQLAPGW